MNVRNKLAYALVSMFLVVNASAQTTDDAADEADEAAEVFEAEVETYSEADRETRREQEEEWRETLRFGIDTQVAELISTLTEQRVEALADDIVELLSEDRSSAVIERAIGYFQEIEDPRGESAAREVVSEFDTRTETTVLEAIRYISNTLTESDDDTREVLRTAVEFASERVAAEAALALGRIGDTDSIPVLQQIFERRSSVAIQGNIMLAFGELGPAADGAVEWLIALAESESQSNTVRYYAVDALGRIGSPEAVSPVRALLSSDDALMRAYALSALLALEADDLDTALLSAIRDDNWRVRQLAVEGMGASGNREHVNAVSFVSRRDPDHRVRRSALQSLADLDTGEGWDVIRSLMLSRSAPHESRTFAVELIAEQPGAPTIEALVELYEQEEGNRDRRLLQQLARSASTMESRELEPLYELLLSHEDVAIQTYAVRGIALNRMGSFREQLERYSEREGGPVSLRRAVDEALDNM
ncbi:MAG: HEAT repeat domain-containing protein [Spirochaetota bacterium]